MTKEATQEVKTGVSRREQDMEALTKKRAEERKAELEEKGVMPSVVPEEAKEEPEETPPAEQTEKKPEEKPDDSLEFIGDDGTVIKVPKSAKLKTKVDGEEREETIENVTRSYQKGAAGDKRLQEAAIIRKQLEDKERELTKKEKDFLDKAQQLEANKEGLSTDTRKEIAGKLISALIDADEDAAAELLSQVLPGKQELPDFDKEIDAKLEKREQERKAQKWSADVKDAIEKFKKEYSELAKDPVLFDAVDARTKIHQTENPGASPWEILKISADEVRERFGTKSRVTEKTSPPTPASGRSVIKEEPKPLTRADKLAEMRRSRGQPA